MVLRWNRLTVSETVSLVNLIVGMLQFRHDLGNLDIIITTITITIENHSLDPMNITNTVFLATSIKTTTGASNESNSRKISIPFH